MSESVARNIAEVSSPLMGAELNRAQLPSHNVENDEPGQRDQPSPDEPTVECYMMSVRGVLKMIQFITSIVCLTILYFPITERAYIWSDIFFMVTAHFSCILSFLVLFSRKYMDMIDSHSPLKICHPVYINGPTAIFLALSSTIFLAQLHVDNEIQTVFITFYIAGGIGFLNAIFFFFSCVYHLATQNFEI